MEGWLLEKLQEADMLLIGIGEEFEERSLLKAQPEYAACAEYLEQQERWDLLPLLADEMLREKGRAAVALQRLYQLIGDKNYYLVSTCQTDILHAAGFPADRVVTPCGTLRKKQCICGCEESLLPVEAAERDSLYQAVIRESATVKRQGAFHICIGQESKKLDILGYCPQCQGKMAFNNIYLKKYNEKGYLEDWERYTKWLQGTLKQKLCILELGVNLDFPTVIRFPFEKIGYYNQRAGFIRVNEKLYQLTEKLHDKGISVAENAIDWLLA